MEVGQLYCNSITFDWCKTVSSVSLGCSTKEWFCPRGLWFQIDLNEYHTPWKPHSRTNMMYNKIIQLCNVWNWKTYQKRGLLKAAHDKCPGCSRNDGRSPSNIGGLCQSNHQTSEKRSDKPDNFRSCLKVELMILGQWRSQGWWCWMIYFPLLNYNMGPREAWDFSNHWVVDA